MGRGERFEVRGERHAACEMNGGVAERRGIVSPLRRGNWDLVQSG
jgi:hypothetical protein